jgi:cyanophycinase-like exopeptidase
MPRTLLILLFLAASATQAAPPHASELFLAGGALRTCSDLAPQACRGERDAPERRQPSRYRVDADGIFRALDPMLWRASRDVPQRAALTSMLASAWRDADWSRDELEDHFAAFCPSRPCADQHATSPWQRLLDDEQAALLSALELPQLLEGRRAVERADLADSREQAGVEVLRAFVAAAAARADGRPPRIAVVTASAVDPFDPVDFYLDAFRELGAEAVWWPVDAALQAATASGDCDALESLRREHLQLSARDRVYPDLAEQQRQACLDPDGTAALPSTVQGMFFAGGDQWRHRQAFFDTDDRPNRWLTSLRAAHASGELVVGGTSAGTAVQGGAAMLSNGTSAQALRDGAHARPPMAPGCGRAGRCADGLDEDSLTYWAMDTHFSERARELRLLVLMHAAGVDFALGVDETSAIHVTREGDALHFEAIGAQGGWLFERLASGEDGALAARTHYLAPGARLALGTDGLQALAPLPAAKSPVPAPAGTDALEPEALRALARAGFDCAQPPRLAAGAGYATLECTPGTFRWASSRPDGDATAVGVGNLLLRLWPRPRAD